MSFFFGGGSSSSASASASTGLKREKARRAYMRCQGSRRASRRRSPEFCYTLYVESSLVYVICYSAFSLLFVLCCLKRIEDTETTIITHRNQNVCARSQLRKRYLYIVHSRPKLRTRVWPSSCGRNQEEDTEEDRRRRRRRRRQKKEDTEEEEEGRRRAEEESVVVFATDA